MATYYVRTDGNNANSGTGTATSQAWQTVTYALANATLTSGVNTIYIAPGVYRETPTVTVTPSSTQTLVIQGDTTGSIFTGITPNAVRITNYLSDNTNPSSTNVFTCAKTYVTLRNLSFVMYGNASFTNSEYITIDKCLFESITGSGDGLKMVANGTTSINGTITNSIFIGRFSLNICGPSTGTAFNFNVAISDCLFVGNRTILVDTSNSQFTNTVGNGLSIYNCTFYAVEGIGLFTSNSTHPSTIRNCNFIGNTGSASVGITSQGTNRQTEDFNRFSCANSRNNVTAGLNSQVGATGIDWSMSYINTLLPVSIFAPLASSPLIGVGTPTGAPATDIYANAWTSGTDVGAFARTSFASTSFYYPTERNASTITIAPGSTSQSIELYLGVTGLTASTSGLSARYNRTRTASVSIPLVARTIAQAWTSGGFAEVDATNMPGIYRLDLPDAALAAGADDVTVVVRGASGTNGAVMTVKLSSGGLTEAQTASAVWGADPSGYIAETDFGGVVNATRSLVGTIDTEIGDVASNVWEELRTNHTTAGSFGEYVNAELTTPVTGSSVVRMGPFEVRADGLGASDPLDIQKGAQHGIDIQCVDNNGAGIDITSATVTAKVYNSGATLVDTYSCTATYAADGRAQFTIDTTVTNVPGTYTATITRTTGASDTQVFGPLRIYVRDI
jgi:hypothetical protein